MTMEDSLRAIRDRRGFRVNEDLLVWAARLEQGRQRTGKGGVTLDVLNDTWRKMHITVLPAENEQLMQILTEHRESAAAPSPPPASAAIPASAVIPAPAATPAPIAPPVTVPPAGPPGWYVPPEVVPAGSEEPTRLISPELVRSAEGGASSNGLSSLVGPGSEPVAAPSYPPYVPPADVPKPSTGAHAGTGEAPMSGSPTGSQVAWSGRASQSSGDSSGPVSGSQPAALSGSGHDGWPPSSAPGTLPGPSAQQAQPSAPAPAPPAYAGPSPVRPPFTPASQAPFAGPLPGVGMFVGQADVLNPHDGFMGLMPAPDGPLDLQWEAAQQSDAVLLYLIVASRNRIPNTAAEGERLTVVTVPHAQVPFGSRYYAVFAYQGKDPVAAARDVRAVRQAVGQVVPSPLDVNFVVNPDSVVLEWQQPAGVNGIQLRRSEPDEPLPNFADASLIKQVHPGQTNFLDLEVEPGLTYFYELVCEADAPRIDGGVDQSPPWSSGPVTIPATPERIDGLAGTMLDEGSQVKCSLSWPEVKRGKVSIYAKPGDPGQLAGIAPGRILTAEDLTKLPLGNRVVWGVKRENGRNILDRFAVDVSINPEWCFTPVTEMAGKFVLGRSQVLTHVGGISEVDFTDRIFWQFLRFEWPTGAAEVVAEFDGTQHRTSKEKFELYGGVRLNMSAHPTVVRLWGTRTYRGVPLSGRSTDVSYPGRRIVFYQIEDTRFGNGRRLLVRPEVPMPDLEMAVFGGSDLYPLIADSRVQPGVDVVHQFQLPANGMSPSQWTMVAEFKQPAVVNYLRLFVHGNQSEPIAAVELPPPPPLRLQKSQRCPNCLAPPDPAAQYFRCGKEGTCQPVEDLLLTRVRGQKTNAKPWSKHPVERTGPIGQIFCAHCGKATRDEFCVRCGETFPTADWWETDCFAATVLGPRHSGKTSMLQAQSFELMEGLAETWGGHSNPLDTHSRTIMKRYHDQWESGELQEGTQSATRNQALLNPIEFGLGFPQYPRSIAVSLFDVSGEDMEDPETVALYSNSILNGDALIYLVDPLQISEVRTALTGFVTLPPDGGATPVQGLQNIISVVRRKYGMATRLPVRLAVVFSKFDAIHQATSVPESPIAGALPFGSAVLRDPYSNPASPGMVYDTVDGLAVHNEARTLMKLLGGASILNLVETNFADFRYFVTSSTGHTPTSSTIHSSAKAPHRLFDPLRWIFQG